MAKHLEKQADHKVQRERRGARQFKNTRKRNAARKPQYTFTRKEAEQHDFKGRKQQR